ncbi:MAG: NAD(P)-dependent glycerol-3-phosphate dehydrogenase [Chlamydiia bacterium]|nr:NAD(P)-dependent glycerol-3-phosphate dehydrogenase [Chlamydiia bacterium]
MKKRIGYLGAGTWGFALSCLLGNKGNEVVCWARNPKFAEKLQKERTHPKLQGINAPISVRFTGDLEDAIDNADILIESVTASGIRPLFQQLAPLTKVPIILTSKGIERGTGLLLPEIIKEVYGGEVGVLSGPSHAEEVIQQLPTSIVCSAYDLAFMHEIQKLFVTPSFRVYPNTDIIGVAFGGAMKNIIAIACGMADGLGSGDNAKASLMTRGLHEMRKLSVAKNARPETLNGLSGLGDLVVTCMSLHSRNYRLGKLLAEGFSPEGARQKIGMAVEGIYTCAAAWELGQAHGIPIPITEGTYKILYEELDPRVAVEALLRREIKQEHL